MCTAGSLPVKWVFHSVVAQPLRKVSLKNLARLDSIYTQIFHAANKLDIRYLALPLIGAGMVVLLIAIQPGRVSCLRSPLYCHWFRSFVLTVKKIFRT